MSPKRGVGEDVHGDGIVLCLVTGSSEVGYLCDKVASIALSMPVFVSHYIY